MNQNETITTNLQRIRLLRNMSQKQLAEQTGISLRTLQCYEQGRRKLDNAGLGVLCRLCCCLRCGIDDLIEDRELAFSINKHFFRKII